MVTKKKIFFKEEQEINIFSHKQTLRYYIANRSTQQEISTEIPEAKRI